MVDAAAVRTRLNSLEEYLTRLASKRQLTFEQMLADWIVYAAIQHMFQVVDPAKVYQFLQTGLDDFRVYIGYITEYLEKTGAL